MTLSRRDRAACVLALECLRGGSINDALAALDLGDLVTFSIYADAVRGETWPTGLLRARLALYLRALLRATDERAWVRGLWQCSCPVFYRRGCGWASNPKGIPVGERCSWCGEFARDGQQRVTPLWERAPRHGEERARR